MLQQIQRHTHRPIISAQLAQTMSLLQLGADELHEAIERELSNNPALELIEAPTCPGCGRKLLKAGPCPVCTAKTGDAIVFTSPAEMFQASGNAPRRDPYEQAENAEIAESLNLPAHLLRQIGPELALEDRAIAAHLLTALDDDGLLTSDPVEVAVYFHIPKLRVEKVRSLIQRAEPLGCASTSPQEALSIQTQVLKEIQATPAQVENCLEHYDLLIRRQFTALAKILGVEEAEVELAARFIGANLNPYPARAFGGGFGAPQPVYRSPDVIIRLSSDAPGAPLIVEISQPTGGLLRVNPLFKRALREASQEKAEDWQADYQRAQMLIKCMSQRAGAMEQIMTKLVRVQRAFILHGDAHLQPLTRAMLAQDLALHESTISRAVAGKSVQLPNQHIVPLSIFFEKHLSIRTALRELVKTEKEPLHDDDLVKRLNQMGFRVARRTVAKYRAMEGILPAYLRK